MCSWRIKVREMVQVRSGLDPLLLKQGIHCSFPNSECFYWGIPQHLEIAHIKLLIMEGVLTLGSPSFSFKWFFPRENNETDVFNKMSWVTGSTRAWLTQLSHGASNTEHGGGISRGKVWMGLAGPPQEVEWCVPYTEVPRWASKWQPKYSLHVAHQAWPSAVWTHLPGSWGAFRVAKKVIHLSRCTFMECLSPKGCPLPTQRKRYLFLIVTKAPYRLVGGSDT